VTVTSVQKDPENLTLTLTAEFDAAPERVWQLWEDPRQFERWWGQPAYPATATALDLRPGGKVEYHWTGPEGDITPNVWEVLEVDPPRLLVFRDAIVDEADVPVDEGPSAMTVKFEPIEQGRTRMSIQSKFPTSEALKLALEMDMDKMLARAVEQMEAILAESQSRVGAA
jgi:uncharacterized protein YndB with AHSA1/START domain